MKNLILKSMMILSVFALISFSAVKEDGMSKHMFGTWKYEAPDAPYQYQEGIIVFDQADGKPTGYVSIESYKIPVENIKVKAEKVTCETYIEGQTVYFEIFFKKDTFKGTASYSEGEIEITGERVRT